MQTLLGNWRSSWGARQILEQPVKTDLQQREHLPVHTTLDTSRLEQVLGAAEHDVWSFLGYILKPQFEALKS